jgi:protoporphyrin/coproporphyrin ferrochelatase
VAFMEWAVLLMAYGGPDSLDDVGPYLLDVRGGRETPYELVEEVRERYALIGGRSPLLSITRQQAEALENHLNTEEAGPNHYKVFVGMRHWTPYIREMVDEIAQAGYRQVIALCMAPYFSKMSIGAYAEKLRQALEEQKQKGIDLNAHMVEAWNTHPGFIGSLVERVREGLDKFPPAERDGVQVVFTAHSLPVAIMKQGDPYADQFQQTAALVADACGLPEGRWQTGFQSAGASSIPWLGPSLEEMLPALAQVGKRSVLIAPIGFVADHVEILYDIDIFAQEIAGNLGIHLERTQSSNTSPAFIAALADIVTQKVSSAQSI